jgi:anthranilate phosphoribosyltransferase
MSIRHYIKEIGRGKDGARALDVVQAHDLMRQVLAGEVTDLELGAFAIAMRIKGESIAELTGFLQAVAPWCLALRGADIPVVLPSYNGARKLANLTPLLAGLLAQQGVPVLVHGMPDDPARVTSASVFEALGWALVTDADSLAQAWAAQRPAYIDTHVLCPPLAKLLDVRWVVGLRNSGHTIAKLLDPFAGTPEAAPTLRVVNYTHPEYGQVLSEFLGHTRANAVLMRGTEGEPVADARRQPKLEVFVGGQRQDGLGVAGQAGVLQALPALPSSCDAQTTAQFIHAILQGQQPAPASLLTQRDCLLQTRRHMRKTEVAPC